MNITLGQVLAVVALILALAGAFMSLPYALPLAVCLLAVARLVA